MKWFKHDASANRDDKLGKVLLKYGADGYALYWLCLELIADRLDKDHADFELRHDAELLGAMLKVDTLRVEEIMKYFLTLQLFENNSGAITCMKLSKRLEQSIVRNPNIKAIALRFVDDKPGQSKLVDDKPCQIRLDQIRLDKEKSKKATPRAEFVPPALSEIQAYCTENKYHVDAKHFLDYYSANDWKDSRDKPIKNWKLKLVSWANRDKQTSQEPDAPRTCPVCGKIQHSDICKNQDCPTVRAIMDADTDALWASAPADWIANLIESPEMPEGMAIATTKDGKYLETIPDQDPLYRTLWDSFLAITPRFANYGKEGKACHALLKAIRNLSPKAPEDAAKAILERFAAKRNGSDKFWKGQPFTPSGLLPLVDRIVADLQADQGKEIDPEVLEGVRF